MCFILNKQAVIMFSMDIQRNIKFGNIEAKKEEVIKASKIVNVHDFILQQRDGYCTNVT